MAEKKQQRQQTVGRRKTASARIRMVPGSGTVVVNGKSLKEYFPLALLQQKVLSPLVTVGREKTMDVSAKVAGGGVSGQADAVRHGIARALVLWEETLKPALKAEGFLTRDPRERERKHFGRHRARRGHQWRKR